MATSVAFVGELEGSGFTDWQAERFDSYDYSRCRRFCSSCVVSSFHTFCSRGCLAGHIRFGDMEFRVVRSCVVLTKPRGISVRSKLGGLSNGLGWPVCSSDSLSSHSRLVVTLFLKATGRIRFVDVRPVTLRDRTDVGPEYAIQRLSLLVRSPPHPRFPFAGDPNQFRVSTSTKRPPRSCEPERSPPSSCVSSGPRECDRRWLEPRRCTADWPKHIPATSSAVDASRVW